MATQRREFQSQSFPLGFTLPLGKNHRENRSLPARDEVDVPSRATRHTENVFFERLKAQELFLDHRQQPGVLGSDFLAELVRWIGNSATTQVVARNAPKNPGCALLRGW